MTYVRNLRLERVRAALLTSAETTGMIALDAGFTHLGRFAAAYRERFGELPSSTRAVAERTGGRCQATPPITPFR
jgi:transcriptional regulator GlxA family with amidase domain